MKAIEHLYRFLEEDKDEKLTTSQIAAKFGLSRSVVSGYLAQLYKKQLVEKYGTRPVYWRIREKPTAFSQIIGYNGSLKGNWCA